MSYHFTDDGVDKITGFYDSVLSNPLPEGAKSLTDTQYTDIMKARGNGEVVSYDLATELPITTTYSPTIADQVAALWNVAAEFQESRLWASGYATCAFHAGISPKAQSMVDWVASVWDLYYTKKADVEAENPYDLDFSSVDGLPFTYKETLTEINDNLP